MGIDFTALIAYQFEPHEMQQLPQLLSSKHNLKLAVALSALKNYLEPYLPDINIHMEWLYSEEEWLNPQQRWADGWTVDLDGPAYLGFSFGRKACVIWNITRWYSFLTDLTAQEALRRVCYELAIILKASKAIYVPDNMMEVAIAGSLVCEGQFIEEVEIYLQERFGPQPHLLVKFTGSRLKKPGMEIDIILMILQILRNMIPKPQVLT